MAMMQTRRRFLTTASLAGAASVFRAGRALAAEGPLETTTVRIYSDPSICIAPARIARDLLRADGFTDIRYIDVPLDLYSTANGRDPLAAAIASGDIDFALDFPALYLPAIEAGVPIKIGRAHV